MVEILGDQNLYLDLATRWVYQGFETGQGWLRTGDELEWASPIDCVDVEAANGAEQA